MRSMASIEPTSAVLPPEAAVPVRGCMTPILKGLACPKACRHGAGTRMVAPRAPAAAAPRPMNVRRVVLPLHQSSFAHASSCQRSVICCLLVAARETGTIGGKGAPTYHQLVRPCKRCRGGDGG